LSTLESPHQANLEALEALRGTDLILIVGGDPADNLLPTLAVPGVADLLRRSKRPRVLLAWQPEAVLQSIRDAAGNGIVTHTITPGDASATGLRGYSVPDLADSARVADALARLWLERGRAWMRPAGK
jgi:hypothetical protein